MLKYHIPFEDFFEREWHILNKFRLFIDDKLNDNDYV